MWEELCYEFAGSTLDVIGVTIIFDNGVPGAAGADPDNWTFFYDDITLVENCPPGPPTELPVDFENDPFDYNFGPDAGFEGAFASVVTNPDQSGINTSSQVTRMVKAAAASGLTFGGATLELDTPADVEAGSSFTMKVWATRQVPVLLQPEPQGPGSGIEVIHTGTGWEELTFSLPALAGTVSGITVIFDINVLGDFDNNPADWTFYFDDITLVPPGSGGGGGGGGGASSGTTPEFVLFGTTAPADAAIPAAPDGPQDFGSGATFDFAFADSSFDPVIAVTAGENYGADVWVAFLAVTGYSAGFADGYDTFNAKVKGSPDNRIEVKLIGNGDDSVALVDVTTYAGSTDLGDGWYELSIPFSEFTNPGNISGHTGWLVGPPGDQADAVFVFLLTDVGFSNSAGGGGGATGVTPDFVLFGTTAPADAAIPAAPDGPQDFGSGATFDFAFADSSFDPVIAVTAGENYGADVWVAFLAVTGYSAGFADGYDTFNAKVKGSPDNRIEVKLIGNGDDSVATVDVTTYAGSTDLGDGWYQLEIPYSEFTNVANIPGHTGWLLGPPGDQADAVFVFLMTDVGFSDSGGGGGGGTGALVNGDFETGDFTGWTPVFGPPGIGTAAPDNSGQGGRSGTVARLNAAGQGTTGNDVLIVQGPIGAGTIQAGDTITVSFDLYGSLAGPGGVVFVEVIFLDGAGNDNGRDFLDNDPTPYFPNGTWTTYSGDVTAGTRFDGSSADVSGGITLSLKAACGADVACAADASFDNVTLTIN